jgi:hypothetical protein
LYVRPNLRQRLQRHSVISPQFGQGNFVASCPGEIILLQLVHVGMFKAALVVSFVDVIFYSPSKDKLEGLNI